MLAFSVHSHNAAAMWEALALEHGELLIATDVLTVVAPSPHHALRALVLDPRLATHDTVEQIVDVMSSRASLPRRVVEDASGQLDLRAYGFVPRFRMAVMGLPAAVSLPDASRTYGAHGSHLVGGSDSTSERQSPTAGSAESSAATPEGDGLSGITGSGRFAVPGRSAASRLRVGAEASAPRRRRPPELSAACVEDVQLLEVAEQIMTAVFPPMPAARTGPRESGPRSGGPMPDADALGPAAIGAVGLREPSEQGGSGSSSAVASGHMEDQPNEQPARVRATNTAPATQTQISQEPATVPGGAASLRPFLAEPRRDSPIKSSASTSDGMKLAPGGRAGPHDAGVIDSRPESTCGARAVSRETSPASASAESTPAPGEAVRTGTGASSAASPATAVAPGTAEASGASSAGPSAIDPPPVAAAVSTGIVELNTAAGDRRDTGSADAAQMIDDGRANAPAPAPSALDRGHGDPCVKSARSLRHAATDRELETTAGTGRPDTTPRGGAGPGEEPGRYHANEPYGALDRRGGVERPDRVKRGGGVASDATAGGDESTGVSGGIGTPLTAPSSTESRPADAVEAGTDTQSPRDVRPSGPDECGEVGPPERAFPTLAGSEQGGDMRRGATVTTDGAPVALNGLALSPPRHEIAPMPHTDAPPQTSGTTLASPHVEPSEGEGHGVSAPVPDSTDRSSSPPDPALLDAPHTLAAALQAAGDDLGEPDSGPPDTEAIAERAPGSGFQTSGHAGAASESSRMERPEARALRYAVPSGPGHHRGRSQPPGVLDIPGWRVWLAYRQQVPAGAAYTYDDGTSVGVYQVATLPEHRGHGVARTLMAAIIDAYPHRPITLTATDQGRPLYSALGFQTLSSAVWWVPIHTDDDRSAPLR